MLFRFCGLIVFFFIVGTGCLGTNDLRSKLACLTDADCKSDKISIIELFCKDNICQAVSCKEENQTRRCFTGTHGCPDAKDPSKKCKGECRFGKQTCKNGFWGSCKGQVLPKEEICSGKTNFCCDGKDNNCNGSIDESFTSSSICNIEKPKLANGAGGIEVCVKGKKTCSFANGMVYLKSKSSHDFHMGSPQKEDNAHKADEGTNGNPVVMSFTYNFGIGLKEVTQKAFKEIMGYLPEKNKNTDPNAPVVNVSWHEAAMYTNLLSKKQGLTVCFECSPQFDPSKGKPFAGKCEIAQIFSAESLYATSCPGYRLPTETEWEYAYRVQPQGGVYTPFYGKNLNLIAWYQKNAKEKRHPVGTKIPNRWNLFDMSGNVAEWVFDLYQDNLSSTENNVGPRKNNASKPERVYRGGSFDSPAEDCRGASRQSRASTDKDITLGFRIARTLVGAKK